MAFEDVKRQLLINCPRRIWYRIDPADILELLAEPPEANVLFDRFIKPKVNTNWVTSYFSLSHDPGRIEVP
jgi:hypothetical protein